MAGSVAITTNQQAYADFHRPERKERKKNFFSGAACQIDHIDVHLQFGDDPGPDRNKGSIFLSHTARSIRVEIRAEKFNVSVDIRHIQTLVAAARDAEREVITLRSMLWINLKEAGMDGLGIQLAHPCQIGSRRYGGFFSSKADWKWRVLRLGEGNPHHPTAVD